MKSLLLITIGLAAPLHAAVLSSYTFASDSLSATTSAPSISAGAVTNGGGLVLKQSGFDFLGSSSGPRAVGWASALAIPGTVGEAITNNQFFTFSLTPAGGQQMDLTNITFNANIGNAASVARSFELQASTNGGTFAAVGTGTLILNGATTSAAFNFLLTSYTGITSQTTFRFVPYDAGFAATPWNDGNWIRLDDIIVNGTVSPIPEASGVALMAVGLLGIASRRRRA